MKQQRITNPKLILGFIIICLFIGGTGFMIGKNSSNSQEQALMSAQNTIDVYAAAEKRNLGNITQLTGSIKASSPQEIKYTGTGIITTVEVERGQTVTPGTLVATVDSNPVIAVQGSDKPIYRDITADDTGYDVEAVQEILNQLGYPTPITGKFDDATQKSAEQLFANIGYTSPCQNKICILTGTFLKVPADLAPVDETAQAGTNTAENPVLFTATPQTKQVQARVGVAQKSEFDSNPEITIASANSEIARTSTYSFSDFKEAQGTELPGYDLTVELDPDLPGIPENKTPVTLTLNTQAQEYLAVPAVAIRQEGTETYVLTESGERVTVEVLTQEQGWAGIAETRAITVGTKVKVS